MPKTPHLDHELETPGQIARRFGAELWRVQYVLRTHPDIRHETRVGRLRLYSPSAVQRVGRELRAMDQRAEVSRGS